MIGLVIVGYLLCCVLAYQLYKAEILRDFDFTVEDRFTGWMLCWLGPVSLVLALIFYLAGSDKDRVLEKRRG